MWSPSNSNLQFATTAAVASNETLFPLVFLTPPLEEFCIPFRARCSFFWMKQSHPIARGAQFCLAVAQDVVQSPVRERIFGSER
jgi:hypothetical protein